MTITVETQNGEVTEQVADQNESKPAPEAKEPTEQKDESDSGADQTEEGEEKSKSKESDDSESKSDDSKKESDGDDDDEEETKEAAKEKPKKKGGFQRRIDKLNKRLADKDSEIEHWKREALKNNATEPESDEKPEAESKANGRPNADDYETHEDYLEALTDWKADQKWKQWEAKQEESKVKAERESKVTTYQERENEFAAKTEDYHEVLEGVADVEASPAIMQLLVESENGPELAYELAKHREEFERINELNPMAAAREFGKFEARVLSKPTSEKKQEKKITKAPEPIKPVGSKSGSAGKDPYKDAENMSQKEFEAWLHKNYPATG